jgi:[acyl-carrier-protein] S-malonyltransferase
MTLVFMFPGQSSRYPTMIDKLVRIDRRNGELLETASSVLGRDIGRHYRSDNQDMFSCNQDVQLGVFIANHMCMAMLERSGIGAELSLGLSLGEYNHLVHIGALSFEEALVTVSERGAAYDAGPRGAMASIFPLELDELEEVVERARQGAVLEVVNLNSPRQHVLSGDTAALDRALGILEEEHFVSAVIIEREVPMHSSLFAPVGERLRTHLQTVDFKRPTLPYLPNRLAEFVDAPDFVELLASHVHQPVLWRRSVDLVLDSHPGAFMLEVGPKAVLTNLLDRKWRRDVRKAAMDSREDTGAHWQQLSRGLEKESRGLEQEAQRAAE